MQFEQQYGVYLADIEKTLEGFLPIADEPWPANGVPQNLSQAMRYSLLAGGKRLRPILLLASYRSKKDDFEVSLPFAAALEMIHTYSLIHDDLPAMDNDDLRRGKPSNHKAFGEAMAILSGDALLNLAFETMAESNHPYALKAIRQIASRTGARGMIAGQVGDISMEGKAPDESMLCYIHQHKTADLIAAAVLAGLALAGSDEESMDIGKKFGYHLGLAFQIHDDLSDILGSETSMGKRVNKDKEIGKMTWPSLHGIKESQTAADFHLKTAVQSAEMFGEQGQFLMELAQHTFKN